MTSPTQLSLKHLRDSGYTAQIVELTVPHTFIKRDLFGIGDIVAIRPLDQGVLMIQTTSDGARKAHIDKIAANTVLKTWLGCGNRFELHCWGKKSKLLKNGKWSKTKWWRLIVINYDEAGFDKLAGMRRVENGWEV